jgi:hypothetical protein
MLEKICYLGFLMALSALVWRTWQVHLATKICVIIPVGAILALVGSLVVIPAVTAELTYEEYRKIGQQRVQWWTHHFKERKLVKLSYSPTFEDECQVFIHIEAFNVLMPNQLQVFEGITNICIFDGADAVVVPHLVKGSKFKRVFLLGHGVLNESGEETFARGFTYSRFKELARETGKQITILSCRGTREDGDKSHKLRWIDKDMDAYAKHKALTQVEATLPHREASGFWVYGRRGFTVRAQLEDQLKGWRTVMGITK